MLDEHLIRTELSRVLSDRSFIRSRRLSELLTYIVLTHLEQKSPITEIMIAQDVFDKTADFDPILDSIVRTTANRLRRTLDLYYKKAGVKNSIKIILPVGAYTPSFEEANREILTKKTIWSAQLSKKMALIACTLLVVSGLIFASISTLNPVLDLENSTRSASLSKIKSYPSIAILPFENLTGDERFDVLEAAFQRQLVRDISFFHIFKANQVNRSLPMLITDEDTSFSYAITGSLLELDPKQDILVKLVDLKSGQTVIKKRLSKEIEGQNYSDLIFKISSEVAKDVASRDGILLQEEMSEIQTQISSNSLIVGNLTAFECYAVFEQYGVANTGNFFEKSWDCLSAELIRNPEDATLMSAKSMLMAEAGILNANPKIKAAHKVLKEVYFDPSITIDMAIEMAEQAVSLDPKNNIALMNLADIQRFRGDHLSAKLTLEQVLEFNPANTDALALYAMVQGFLGDFEQSEKYAQEAIERRMEPKGYFFKPLLQSSVARRDFDSLRIHLEAFKTKTQQGRYFTSIYETALAIDEGNIEKTEALKIELQNFYEKLGGDLFSPLKRDQTPEKTLEVLEDLFNSAGIRVI